MLKADEWGLLKRQFDALTQGESVGAESIEEINGNRILGDRRNYCACGGLHLCSEPSETQGSVWTRTFHV